jgi:hypothetical protein
MGPTRDYEASPTSRYFEVLELAIRSFRDAKISPNLFVRESSKPQGVVFASAQFRIQEDLGKQR